MKYVQTIFIYGVAPIFDMCWYSLFNDRCFWTLL